MGKKIKIKQYVYELPTQPSVEFIDGSQYEETEQYWRRLEPPKPYGKLSPVEQNNWYEKMLSYRIDGYWFWNYNPKKEVSEPCYITGDNFFFLNYIRIDNDKFPDFRMAQRDYFYFLDLCDKDPLCHGSVKGKYRREGATTMILAKFANRATIEEKKKFGIQSKTGEDAKNVCYLPLVDMVNGLPKYFKPVMASNDRPQREMLFRAPSIRLTRKNQKENEEDYDEYDNLGLQTRIDFKATDSKAYDGKKLFYWLCDEFSKWAETDPMDCFVTVKRSLTLGGNKIIVGKVFVVSTSDEKDSPAFEQWKILWDSSNPDIRGEDGKTISGLYRYFIPAYEGLEGFIDKYGYCDEQAAKKHLDLERKKLEDTPQRMIAELRQMPQTEDEMLNMGSGTSPLDPTTIIRISERKREIELTINKTYIIGNFQWVGGQRDTSVEFISSKKGRWCFVMSMQPSITNNIRRLPNGKFAPPQQKEYVMGIDSYDYEQTQKAGSRGTSHIKKQLDYFEIGNSNMYATEYWYRHPDPFLFYEDMIVQAVFFGAHVLPERKNYGIFKYFKERGYENFLMTRPVGIKGNTTTKKDNFAGLPATADVTKAGIELIESYFSRPRNQEQIDYLKYFPFERTLDDILRFDPKNTQKSDLTMSLIYTVFAAGELKKMQKYSESSMGEAISKLFFKSEAI